MRRFFLVTLCALAALGVPAAALAEHVTITLTSLTTIENQQLVRSSSHPTKGDQIEFRDLLLNRNRAQFGKPDGKAVAWDEGIVRYTSPTLEMIHVRVTFPFLGTFDYEGPLNSGPHGTSIVPIIAATGAFKGAAGTVTIGPGTGSAPNTVTLTLPGNPISVSSDANVA
jgi:hypothetical protein